MALSDSPVAKLRQSPKRRNPNSKKDLHWSDSQKIEAVQTYLLVGSPTQVSKMLNIPLPTVKIWKSKGWWKEIEDQLKSQENILLGNKLKGIIDESLVIVADRLQNGDFLYNQKTGEIIRKPVLMKDALKAATDLIEKKQKIEVPEHFREAQEGVMERLEKLAKAFEANATKKIEQAPIVEVTDVVFGREIDAVHEKGRDEGLQAGIPEVSQSPGAN